MKAPRSSGFASERGGNLLRSTGCGKSYRFLYVGLREFGVKHCHLLWMFDALRFVP
jgi:hypothetical protein